MARLAGSSACVVRVINLGHVRYSGVLSVHVHVMFDGARVGRSGLCRGLADSDCCDVERRA